MLRNLECCVCGSFAGRFQQHWNRDTGYGICSRCVEEEKNRLNPSEVESYYGVAGVNYADAAGAEKKS